MTNVRLGKSYVQRARGRLTLLPQIVELVEAGVRELGKGGTAGSEGRSAPDADEENGSGNERG
jgi:hypothetical protein